MSIADIIGDDDNFNPTGTTGTADIIGGADVPVAEADILVTRESLTENLWLQDLDLANEIFARVAMGKVAFITFFYFIYYLAGTRITGFYYWTWTISLITIYGFWGPVAVSWYYMD